MRRGNVNFFLLLNEVKRNTKRELKLIYRLKELPLVLFLTLNFHEKNLSIFQVTPKTFFLLCEFSHKIWFLTPHKRNEMEKLFNLLFINMNRAHNLFMYVQEEEQWHYYWEPLSDIIFLLYFILIRELKRV